MFMYLNHWGQSLFSPNALNLLNLYLGTCSSYYLYRKVQFNVYWETLHLLLSWHLTSTKGVHWFVHSIGYSLNVASVSARPNSQDFVRPEVQQRSVFPEVTDKPQFVPRRDRFHFNTYRNAIACPSGEINVIWICRNPSISSFNIRSNIFTDAIYTLTGSVGSCDKQRMRWEFSTLYVRFSVC